VLLAEGSSLAILKGDGTFNNSAGMRNNPGGPTTGEPKNGAGLAGKKRGLRAPGRVQEGPKKKIGKGAHWEPLI